MIVSVLGLVSEVRFVSMGTVVKGLFTDMGWL